MADEPAAVPGQGPADPRLGRQQEPRPFPYQKLSIYETKVRATRAEIQGLPGRVGGTREDGVGGGEKGGELRLMPGQPHPGACARHSGPPCHVRTTSMPARLCRLPPLLWPVDAPHPTLPSLARRS